MKLHRNAKTTPTMRALIVQRIRQEQWPPAEAAAAAGISVRTTYKWLRRHRLGARPALDDASSRPNRQPRRTSSTVVAAIVAARTERQTAWAIATRLQVPRSTVAAVLVRVGLNRLARLEPPAPVVRYERTRPGELVHLDIKPLGRILRVGHRILPHRRSSVGAGWEYVHVAVDDDSRAAYAEVLPDQTGHTVAGFLRRTVGWFARRGITVARVLTDNGSGYRSHRFRSAADRCRVRLSRTRPYRPQTNGKAERFIQTLIRGWPMSSRIPALGVGSSRCVPGFAITTSSARTRLSAINHRASAFRGSLNDQPCQKSHLAMSRPRAGSAPITRCGRFDA